MTRIMTAREFAVVTALASACLLLSFVPCCNAQIILMREKDGKQIACTISGLRGFGSSCGLDDEFYAYILLGTIFSVEPTANDEYRIHFHADEIFRGKPSTDIFAVTNQGQCLPDLRPGDQWLAFLRSDPERGLVLAYENDSRPLNGNQDELVRLRRLAKMTDSGVLLGDVNWSHWHPNSGNTNGPVANYEIIATRKDDRTVRHVFTDKKGHFEFEPLPAGDYVIDSKTAPGVYTADEGNVKVNPRGCMKLNIGLTADGILSGRVSTLDGKPVASRRVYALTVGGEDKGWMAQTTDEHGAFTFRGVNPGQYLLGIGTPNGTESSDPNISVYFPDALSLDRATVISLGNAEHLEGLKIVIPALPK